MQKLQLLLLAFFLCQSATLFAQTPELDWVAATQEVGVDAIATDTAGNVLVVGNFSGTVDFDPGPGTFNLTETGGLDAYIQKLDSNGNFLWAKRMGGTGTCYVRELKTDHDGNIYIVGTNYGTVDFDPGPGVVNLTSSGGSEAYLVKLDADGLFQWVRSIDGSHLDGSQAIGIDTSGNVVWGGNYFNTVDLNVGPGTMSVTSNGNADMFLLKVTPAGNLIWGRTFGGADRDFCFGLDLDEVGNVFLTGNFAGTVDFDPSGGVFELTATGVEHAFVLKLNESGNFLWAKQLGGDARAAGRGIAVASDQSVYYCGIFSDTVDFDPGPGTVDISIDSSSGSFNYFAAKLDSAGNYLWVRALGGSYDDYANEIVLDDEDNAYVAGYYRDTVSFNPTGGTPIFGPSNLLNAFIQQFTPTGDFGWTVSFSTDGSSFTSSLAIDASNTIYGCGSFTDTVDFDPGPGLMEIGAVSSAGFAAKYSPCQPTLLTLDVPALDTLTSACSISAPVGPTATNNCGAVVTGIPDVSFPISSPGTTTITWMFMDTDSNMATQTQTATIIPFDTSVTMLGNTLTAAEDSVMYQWVNCDSGFAPIPAATGQSYLATASGNYAAILMDGSCTDTTACLSVIVVDRSSALSTSTVSIFPNPTSGYVQILGGEAVSVFDPLGRQVMHTKIEGPIDLSGFARGIYTLRVKTHRGDTWHKLILETGSL